MNTKKQRQKDLCHCFITSALKFVAITEQKIVILKKVGKKNNITRRVRVCVCVWVCGQQPGDCIYGRWRCALWMSVMSVESGGLMPWPLEAHIVHESPFDHRQNSRHMLDVQHTHGMWGQTPYLHYYWWWSVRNDQIGTCIRKFENAIKPSEYMYMYIDVCVCVCVKYMFTMTTTYDCSTAHSQRLRSEAALYIHIYWEWCRARVASVLWWWTPKHTCTL